MLKVFDLRAGEGRNLQRVRQMKVPEPILCGEILHGGSDIAIVGGGQGNIFAYDLQEGGQALYGYGADSAGGAINCMKTSADGTSLITGGDSGQALKLTFG